MDTERKNDDGKNTYDPQSMEGTLTYTEAMKARGYRYVDGKWVP